ncbi:hypothetical protein BpHYR1_015758, partial [Brachionus plicatilis]
AIYHDEDTTIEQSSDEQKIGNHDQEIVYAQIVTIHDLPDLAIKSNECLGRTIKFRCHVKRKES